MSGDDDLTRDLAEALGDIKTSLGRVPEASRGRPQSMALPPGLVEESARILFEFWEREAEKQGHRRATQWEKLPPQFQVAWLGITRVVLEMSTKVLLNDIDTYLDSSNGDMGAAFSRAVRRYAEQVLQAPIPPRR